MQCITTMISLNYVMQNKTYLYVLRLQEPSTDNLIIPGRTTCTNVSSLLFPSPAAPCFSLASRSAGVSISSAVSGLWPAARPGPSIALHRGAVGGRPRHRRAAGAATSSTTDKSAPALAEAIKPSRALRRRQTVESFRRKRGDRAAP